MPTWDEPVQTGAVGAAVGGGAAAAMGASLNSKDVGSMASEAKKMLDSARSGGFRVSEDAAQPILDVIESFRKDVLDRSRDFALLAQQKPALGGHPYGQQVADFQQRAATGDKNSPAEVLNQLLHVLEDAGKALEIAKRKYREWEDSASSSMSSRQV